MSDIRLSRSIPLRSRGFTLIEVLVAVLILSIGVLGVAGMQVTSMQVEREARLQATGVRMARELGDLMRANPKVAEVLTAADNPYLGDFTAAPGAPATNCLSDSCADGKVLAGWEMNDWMTRVADDLPGARALICFDRTPYDGGGLPQWLCSNDGNTAVIKIGWTRSGTQGSGGTDKLDRATRPAVVMPLAPGAL